MDDEPGDERTDAPAGACLHEPPPERSPEDRWDDFVARVTAGERQRLCHNCERWVWESQWWR